MMSCHCVVYYCTCTTIECNMSALYDAQYMLCCCVLPQVTLSDTSLLTIFLLVHVDGKNIHSMFLTFFWLLHCGKYSPTQSYVCR